MFLEFSKWKPGGGGTGKQRILGENACSLLCRFALVLIEITINQSTFLWYTAAFVVYEGVARGISVTFSNRNVFKRLSKIIERG